MVFQLLLLSISWAVPFPSSNNPMDSTETSGISERVDPADPSRPTAERESETANFYHFMNNANPSQPLVETSEPQEYSPSVESSNPIDDAQHPPSYPSAAENVQLNQEEETVVVGDPLYDFLKNVLPQAPIEVAAVESQSPSVPSSHPPANPSYPAEPAAAVQTTPEKSDVGDVFLNIGPPPKPRALGFPPITNTRDNVINQNNWDILV